MSNKQRQKRQKRAQKRSDRQKTTKNLRRLQDAANRRDHIKKRSRRVSEAAALLAGGVNVPDITEDEHIFWLCHGANFMASDEETGVWDPVFEDIYKGQLPETESIAVKVMHKYADYFDDEGGDVTTPPTLKAVLAWTVSEKSSVRIYKYEAETRLRLKDPDADLSVLREPHNATVWGVMAEIKRRSLALMARGSDEAPTP